MPVTFPPGWSRTPDHARRAGPFQVSFAAARSGVLHELRRMGASDVRIDTDLELRRDGLPLARAARPADPAVVVYWTMRGRRFAIACDRWRDVASNMRAVELTLGAKRALERWGAATAEAEYRGYEALPPPSGWAPEGRPVRLAHEVLGVRAGAHKDEISAAFRRLAKELHPDRGGTVAAFDELVRARDELLGPGGGA